MAYQHSGSTRLARGSTGAGRRNLEEFRVFTCAVRTLVLLCSLHDLRGNTLSDVASNRPTVLKGA